MMDQITIWAAKLDALQVLIRNGHVLEEMSPLQLYAQPFAEIHIKLTMKLAMMALKMG